MYYFCGSIRGGLDDVKIYKEIIKVIKEYGPCFTEHVGEEEYLKKESCSDQEIYEKDMNWLRSSTAVIADVSTPSIGVGYELGIAESLKLPTLVLYRNDSQKRISAMISGNKYFTVVYYSSVQEALDSTRKFLNKLKG
jgi:nucleoside 2-deoxyribosyltransferase